MTSTLLQGIANPQIADVPGRFRAGEERGRATKTRELAGEILNKTLGGKLGALGKADPNAAIQLSQALGIPLNEKERLESMMGDVQVAATIFETVGPAEAAKFAAEKASMLEGLGIQPTQYLETIQGLTSQDPAEVQAAGEALITLRDGFISQGLLKGPAADKSGEELRKEVRADLRKQIKDVSKQASAIQTNFKKIQGLTGEISKGNRTAAAQSLIALVKLGEPDSTVREGEMIAALNTQNPVAAIAQLLKGTGSSDEVINAVTASVDPLSPNVIKVDDLLATANALVGANVPGIQASFAEAREQGEENLTKRGLKSIFTSRLTERVSGLSDLLEARPSAGITDAQIQELKAARPDLTEEQIRATLQ